MMFTALKTGSAGILPAVPTASRPRRGGRGRPPDSHRDGGATLLGEGHKSCGDGISASCDGHLHIGESAAKVAAIAFPFASSPRTIASLLICLRFRSPLHCASTRVNKPPSTSRLKL